MPDIAYLPDRSEPRQDQNAARTIFRFPPDPLIQEIRERIEDGRLTQGGRKPFATYAATQAVMEASATWEPLRYNELTNQIEYSDEQWTDELTAAGLAWFETHGVATTKQVFTDSLCLAAQAHSYHPIKRYLEDLAPGDADDPVLLNELLDAYGIDPTDLERRREAYEDAMCAWHTARVARIYDPGCRVDEVLCLAGAQRLAKSGSFKALYPNVRWVDDSIQITQLHNKDSNLKLLGKSIVVFEELPKSRKDKESFKAFIAKPDDQYRRPYGRAEIYVPRQIVFGATINPVDGFLDDPTGERRLVVIHVARMIKWQWLVANRDRINAWALARYRARKAIQPTREHIEQLQEGCWRIDDWQDKVEEKIAELYRRDFPITLDALYNAVGVDLKDRRNDSRVAKILRRMGYEPAMVRVSQEPGANYGKIVEAGGKRIRAWVNPKPPPPCTETPSAEVLPFGKTGTDWSNFK